MKIKYLGPGSSVNLADGKVQKKDEIVDYPEDFAQELLATSKKQRFECVDETDKKTAPEEGPDLEALAFAALVDAGKKVIEDGNTTKAGAPSVDALADYLGAPVTAAQRDQAWVAIQEEFKR